MVRRTLLLAALLGATLTLQAGEPLYRLQQIEDGDTLVIEIDGQSRRIQLAGIDAPEDGDNPKLRADIKRTGLDAAALLPLGRAATAHLKRLAAPGEQVSLSGDLQRRDRYGRTALQVRNQRGVALNRQMVADGFAIRLGRPPVDEPLNGQLLKAQRDARQAQRGLWGSDPRIMRRWAGLTE